MTQPPLNQVPDAAFLRAVLEVAPRVIAVLDPVGTLVWVAGDSLSMVGISPADLIGRNLLDFVPDSDLPLALESMEYAIHSTRPFKAMEFRYVRADGSIGVAEAVSTNQISDPRINGIVLQVHDVTDRSVTDHVLESIAGGGPVSTMLRLVARLVETRLPDSRAIVAIDPFEGHFAVAASSLDSLDQLTVSGADATDADPLGLTKVAEGGQPPPWTPVIEDGRARFHSGLTSLPPTMQAEARSQGFAACWVFPIFLPSSGDIEGCIIVWRRQPGNPSPGERVAVDRASRLVAIALERRDSQEILVHAARHDALTSLPNRSLFFDRLARELQRAEHPVAVLYLDLDGFKSTNDRFGHRAGDHVLVTVARRISDALRPGDLLARLGGDEFGVICPRLTEPHEAEQIAERLITVVSQPVSLPAGTLRSAELSALAGAPAAPTGEPQRAPVVEISASIGIAFGDEVGTDHERLLELADAAMYNAKRRARGTWRMSARRDAAGLVDTD